MVHARRRARLAVLCLVPSLALVAGVVTIVMGLWANVPFALAAGLGLNGFVAFTLVASYMIVFASGFDPAHRSVGSGGLFQAPFSETILAYVIALLVALAMLYGLGQVGSGDPLVSFFTKPVSPKSLAQKLNEVLGTAAGRGGLA